MSDKLIAELDGYAIHMFNTDNIQVYDLINRAKAEISTAAEKAKADKLALANRVGVLEEALNDLLNDCINFDGSKLTDSVLTRASNVLKQKNKALGINKILEEIELFSTKKASEAESNRRKWGLNGNSKKELAWYHIRETHDQVLQNIKEIKQRIEAE